MANENILGAPMPVQPPRAVDALRGAKFEQQDARWKQVVQERLQKALPAPDLTTFGDITTGAIAAAGAITAPSLVATGDITAGDDLIATDNVSGASVTTPEADIRHGDRTVMIHASAFQKNTASNPTYLTATAKWVSVSGGVVLVHASLSLAVGDRVKQIVAYVQPNTASGEVRLRFFKMSSAAALTQVGGTITSTTGTTPEALTLGSLTETIATATGYYVEIELESLSVSQFFFVAVTYDRPGP